MSRKIMDFVGPYSPQNLKGLAATLKTQDNIIIRKKTILVVTAERLSALNSVSEHYTRMDKCK